METKATQVHAATKIIDAIMKHRRRYSKANLSGKEILEQLALATKVGDCSDAELVEVFDTAEEVINDIIGVFKIALKVVDVEWQRRHSEPATTEWQRRHSEPATTATAIK